jgi:hypothetical protein
MDKEMNVDKDMDMDEIFLLTYIGSLRYRYWVIPI